MQRNIQPRTKLLALMALMATTLALPMVSAWAATKPCHAILADQQAQTCTLMTEAECTAHLHKLETLTDGPERTRYLAEHHALIKDRESACSCSVLQNAKTVTYPSVRQSLSKL